MKTIWMTAGCAAAMALGLSALAPASAQPAAPPPTQDGASPTAASPPTAQDSAPATVGRAAGDPTKGHIVFFRPSRLSGAIYAYHIVEVGDDGKPAKNAPHLADLPNGAASSVDVEPGIHSYNITGPMAVNKAEDRLRMEVEPGETYYVEQTLRVGLITGGFRLVPADATRFQGAKVKMNVQATK
jgi:hypothetical protein